MEDTNKQWNFQLISVDYRFASIEVNNMYFHGSKTLLTWKNAFTANGSKCKKGNNVVDPADGTVAQEGEQRAPLFTTVCARVPPHLYFIYV